MTGCCFIAFGVGGILLTATVFPLLYVLPGGRERRKVRAKWILHKCFVALVRVLCSTGVMRLSVAGGERLREAGGALVLANHPSYLDIVVLLSLMPRGSCIVKAKVWRNPFFFGVVRAAGYVDNATADGMIDECVEILAEDGPLVIFPEGTRTTPGQPLRFLRGAAHIALASGRPILPVVITCSPPALTKQQKWHQIPARTFDLRLTALPPLTAAELGAKPGAIPVLAARHLTRALERFFAAQLALHG